MRRKCGLHLVNAMPEGQQFVETIARVICRRDRALRLDTRLADVHPPFAS